MTDPNTDDTAPIAATPAPAPVAEPVTFEALQPQPAQPSPTGSTPAPPVQRFRDRLWSLRAVVAVALASVLLGGAGGAVIANVSDGSGNNGRFGPGNGRFGQFQRGPGNGGQFGRGGRFGGGFGGGFNGQPGQGTAPGGPSGQASKGATPGTSS